MLFKCVYKACIFPNNARSQSTISVEEEITTQKITSSFLIWKTWFVAKRRILALAGYRILWVGVEQAVIHAVNFYWKRTYILIEHKQLMYYLSRVFWRMLRMSLLWKAFIATHSTYLYNRPYHVQINCIWNQSY